MSVSQWKDTSWTNKQVQIFPSRWLPSAPLVPSSLSGRRSVSYSVSRDSTARYNAIKTQSWKLGETSGGGVVKVTVVYSVLQANYRRKVEGWRRAPRGGWNRNAVKKKATSAKSMFRRKMGKRERPRSTSTLPFSSFLPFEGCRASSRYTACMHRTRLHVCWQYRRECC